MIVEKNHNDMAEPLYEMQSLAWWEFIQWLKSAQERGYVTDLELPDILPSEELEREEASEKFITYGSYVFGLFEMMGIKLLDSDTMMEVG